MAEKLTPAQSMAVHNRGGKLLVSAAAGSGKTKVLVDRLMDYLQNPQNPAHLDEFLIITYTKAAAMEQLSAAVKERRAARAAEVASQMHRAYLEGCVGQVYPVLFEQEKDGYYTGHAPNYCETGVRGGDLHNKVLDVKITGTDGDMLIGELT